MSNNAVALCPRCGREAQAQGAAFCAFCGAPIHAAQVETPEEVKKRLLRIEEEEPEKQYILLGKLQQEYPDCLAIEEALLMLGRLHQRNRRTLDYSVIKCYLWQMYLTPKAFDKAKSAAMREELFNHPQLQKCLSLAPDADAFMRHYLEKLAGKFIDLFLKGSTTYNKSILGIRLDTRYGKTLASPVGLMLHSIQQDTALGEMQRMMLYDALYRAFQNEVGDTRWLDDILTQKGMTIPAKV